MGIDNGLDRCINRNFLDLMAKEVTANIGGQTIVTTNYELFLSEMIKYGIKGNSQARKLVLDFLLAAMASEARQKTDEAERETEGESPEVFILAGMAQKSSS